MLGKLLYEHYWDSGSSQVHASYKIATDKMKVELTSMSGDRRSGSWKEAALEITPFSLPRALYQKGARIEKLLMFIDGDYTIRSAERYFLGENDKRMIVADTPSGRFICNMGDHIQWTKEVCREKMEADPSTLEQLADHAQKAVSQFQMTYGPIMERRIRNIGLSYPIGPKRFFGTIAAEQGIGPVYRELFHIDESKSGSSLHGELDTSTYHIGWNYAPQPGIGLRMQINRGNLGFDISFDTRFEILRVEETGAFLGVGGALYLGDNLKETTGREIVEAVAHLWGELSQELRFQDRIGEFNRLKQDDLNAAKDIVNYMAGQGPFPLKVVSAQSVHPFAH